MKKLLVAFLAVMMTLSLFGCQKAKTETYNITVWVSEKEGVKELTQSQIDKFLEANQDIKFNVTIEGVSEGEAATQMIADVESGADIFCFAQDQLARLVLAGALAKPGVATQEEIKKSNTPGAVTNASISGEIYAYPLTDDNGYFMFYDKSVVKEEHLNDLAAIVKDCEDAGRNFSFQIEGSGWYTASFFFGTGCHSDWTVTADGEFTGVDDDFYSEKGLAAMKGMQILLKSPAYTNSEAGTSDFTAAIPSAVVISGTWDVTTAKDALGDNYGVAKLPCFTVDGKTYQLGSFSGSKLMGVKPQTDANKAAALQKLAAYLTNTACQLERYNQFGWGPASKEALQDKGVQEDVALLALGQQNEFAVPQGQINGVWFTISKALATGAKNATTDEELNAVLESYNASLASAFTTGYVFVGAWNGWDNADVDNFGLTQQGESWTITLDVPQSDYMGGRIVSATTWETDKGCLIVKEGVDLLVMVGDPGNGDNNIVFAEPGNYTVTWNSAAGEITIKKN